MAFSCFACPPVQAHMQLLFCPKLSFTFTPTNQQKLLRHRAHLWNILHETCFINILHAKYLQPSAHKGNIFHPLRCNLSIWIDKKHNNNVWSCATLPNSTQLISFMKYTSSCFKVCAVPLKYIDLLHRTNIS